MSNPLNSTIHPEYGPRGSLGEPVASGVPASGSIPFVRDPSLESSRATINGAFASGDTIQKRTGQFWDTQSTSPEQK